MVIKINTLAHSGVNSSNMRQQEHGRALLTQAKGMTFTLAKVDLSGGGGGYPILWENVSPYKKGLTFHWQVWNPNNSHMQSIYLRQYHHYCLGYCSNKPYSPE